MSKSKIISTLLLGTCLLTLASCGSDDDGSSAVVRQEQEQDDQGFYRAVLRPLNSSVGGETSGTVEIRIEGDNMTVDSNVAGAPAGVKHLQNITTAGTCPSASADLNADTFVDVAELLPSTGPILIPLDSDLSEQLDGLDFGPIANGEGTYVYRRSTTLSRIMADLTAPDPDPVDPIVKLLPGENLNLDGRVVIIHGVDSSSNLPDSVVSAGDLTSEQTLPIACGELVRITTEEASFI